MLRHTSGRRACAVATFVSLAVLPAARPAAAQDAPLERYQRAERFLPDPVKQLVFDGQVDPHWIGKSTRFWYVIDGPSGKQFFVSDAATASRAPAFDHEKLAAALSRVTGRTLNARALPFESIRFTADTTLRVNVGDKSWTCQLASYACDAAGEATDDDEEDGPPGARAGAPSTRLPRTERTSPDGRFVAFVRDHNLWIRVAKTGESFPLTHDGERYYDYATPLPSPTIMVAQGTEDVIQAPAVFWSPDSRRLATYVMDQRNFPRLSMTQSAPPDQFRPKYFTYAYPLPVDNDLPTATLKLFDVERRRPVPVSARPLTMLYYGGPTIDWSADGTRFTYREIERGYEHVRYRAVDAVTGASRDIVDERGAPLVSTSILLTRLFNGGRELIWSAERDGWNHFYLYDAESATLKGRITSGDWVVRAVHYVDEKNRVLYFSGAGREAGRDPYLRHVYKVNLDGTGLTLLTPEDADHAASFSPDGEFFVDAFSRPDLPTVSVVRRSRDGSVVGTLEKADASRLTALGWTMPEPFTVKAADGKTDLYGVIWRPTHFDSKKKYPLVENIYTGPQGAYVPKTFAAYRHQQQAIAELGFIAVFVDGRGTALRSRAFATPRTRTSGAAPAVTTTSRPSSSWRRSIPTSTSRASACGGTPRAATIRRTRF